MNDINDLVEETLKNYPDARNSDKRLLIRVWDYQGLKLTNTQAKKFMKCTPAETITRARRNFRTKYPASKGVENTRMALGDDFRKFYGH